MGDRFTQQKSFTKLTVDRFRSLLDLVSTVQASGEDDFSRVNQRTYLNFIKEE